MDKLHKLIDRSLDTRVTPIAYLFLLHGIVTGLAYGFLNEYSSGVANSILYKEGALVGVSLWGIILLVGCLVTLFGMKLKIKSVVGVGAFLGFLAWVFAATVYFENGHYLWLGPLAVVYTLSFGYIFLAASLDRLWDYTPSRS